LRDERAATGAVIVPPVIRTHDLVAGHPPERQGGASMDTDVAHRPGDSCRVTPHDDRLTEERHGYGLAGHVGGEGNRVPALDQR
jgi:hypothetical protein